jgi:cobalt-precorrin 5A hydrolase
MKSTAKIADAALYHAGIGCRRGCGATALRELLERALREHGVDIARLASLASIDARRAESGLHDLALQLNLPLRFFSATQLAAFESRLSVPSPVVLRATGVAGIAEACALAAAESGASAPAVLLGAKIKNAAATCALARISPTQGDAMPTRAKP